MIGIISRDTCCGCEACRQICPMEAIEMLEDEEGFLYPEITGACIRCSRCLKVCPVYSVERGGCE